MGAENSFEYALMRQREAAEQKTRHHHSGHRPPENMKREPLVHPTFFLLFGVELKVERDGRLMVPVDFFFHEFYVVGC